MAAMVPEAGLGPMIPAKKITNVTGSVTTAAIQAVLLTIVPMTSARLPTRASPTCPASLSLQVPPNAATTSVANPPKVANNVICGSPATFRQIANSAGMTSVARNARIPACLGQSGFRQGRMGVNPTYLVRLGLVGLRVGRARQLDLDRQPAPRGVGQPDRPAVGRHQAVHDGEAKTGPVLAAGGVPQERPRPLLRGHPRAVVRHGQHRSGI